MPTLRNNKGFKLHFSQQGNGARYKTNNLTKISAVDAVQLRGLDVQRFIRKIGDCSPELMEEIATAIAAVVEYF